MTEAELGQCAGMLHPPAVKGNVSIGLPRLRCIQEVTLNSSLRFPKMRTQRRPLWPEDIITTA